MSLGRPPNVVDITRKARKLSPDLRVTCKYAGTERATPHTFHYTFGSWLVQAG
jgi:integrase